MSVSDPIADFLTCVRNALKAKKEEVVIPSSKVKESISQILKDEKFISNFQVLEEGKKKYIKLYLRYLKGNKPALKNIRRVSRPSLRRYVEVDRIPRVLNGLGVVVLSTSKGIMTGTKAREENVGGEVVCKVW